MRDDGMRQVGVSEVPDAIRDAVLAEARQRDVSLGSLVVEIVGRCHGIDLPATGRMRQGTTGEPPWVIRMPFNLLVRLIRAQGKGGRLAKSRLILACLADHYDLPAESPLNRSLAQPRGEGGRFVGRS